MARKPTARSEFVLFDVIYEDGSQRSNRRVSADILGGLDGDEPARAERYTASRATDREVRAKRTILLRRRKRVVERRVQLADRAAIGRLERDDPSTCIDRLDTIQHERERLELCRERLEDRGRIVEPRVCDERMVERHVRWPAPPVAIVGAPDPL